MQDAKGTKCAKGVRTIEDDETVKMMNKICDEGSAIENILVMMNQRREGVKGGKDGKDGKGGKEGKV